MLYFTEDELLRGSNFIMLVGAPGAGKSTFAINFINKYDDWVRISPDVIREKITGSNQDMTRNKEVFSQVYSDITNFLCDGKNIIYDATNCNPKNRHKIMRVVNKYAYKSVCLIFSTNLMDCIKNVEWRGSDVPVEVIERMYINLKTTKPSINEGYDIIAVM